MQPERITLTPYKPVLVGDRYVSIGGKRKVSLLVFDEDDCFGLVEQELATLRVRSERFCRGVKKPPESESA